MMNTMLPATSLRRLAALVFCFGVIGASAGYAQEADPEADPETALREGVYALQFQIAPHFRLSSFQGSVLSAKKHLTEDRALRFGLSLGANVTNTEYERSDSDIDDEQSQSQQRLSLAVQYMVHPTPDQPVQMYYGAGPELGFARYENTNEDEDFELTRISTSWSIGLSGMVGAEWFVRSDISLMAEYGAALSYRRATDRQETNLSDEDPREVTQSSFGFGGQGVHFGVSVYF